MTKYCYIHIPFCKKKCKYCSFVSYINLNLIDEYINSLQKQIKAKYKNEALKTLYIGGGTPSIIKIEQLKKIIELFRFEINPEITIEVNPENGNIEYLKKLSELGFNRISIGVQSFNQKLIEEIGRCHSVVDSYNSIENAKAAGFKNISIDLIYGLNNQTLDDWTNDLKIAKELSLEHISTYGLKIEDGTYYSKFTPKNLPDENMQAKMYEICTEELKDYTHYEISNFAKNKNYISKHNLNYWNLKPYYGFGLNASGLNRNIRYKNTINIKNYINDPTKLEDKIKLNKEELLEEYIFLGFRKKEGINTDKINKKFDINFEDKYKNIIQKYLKTGHIKKTKNGYCLSIKGVLISNYILCDFLC